MFWLFLHLAEKNPRPKLIIYRHKASPDWPRSLEYLLITIEETVPDGHWDQIIFSWHFWSVLLIEIFTYKFELHQTFTDFCLLLSLVPYIVQDYFNVAGFLIFETLCLGSSKTLYYVWEKYHKNERHLCLHLDISICQKSLQIMECPLILVRFLVFSYIINEHSCLNYCIFTKLSQILCVISIHILVCQLAKKCVKIFGVFSHKLLQNVC